MKTTLRPLSHTVVGLVLAVLSASSGPLALRHAHSGTPVTGIPVSLPLSFEANQGQADSQVNYLARGPSYTVFLTDHEAVLTLKPAAAVRIHPVGARNDANVQALDQLPGISNYFIGSDPAKWRTGIPTYGKVRYEGIYPGIDLVYYGNQRQLEFDFVVAPGADPSVIGLAFQGIDTLQLDSQGDLVLKVGGKEVRMEKPAVYQVMEGGDQRIAGEYVLKAEKQVGFMVAAYDTTRPLVIDPVLSFSTYLGGGGEDAANGIFVDGSGFIYVTGSTTSDSPTAFPTTSGAFSRTYGGSGDAFVTKIDPNGPTLLYSAYLGGGGQDSGNGIFVDGSGFIYVTGSTTSDSPTAFPTTFGAFSRTYGGSGDAFVTKINPAGQGINDLLYSTYLGGGGQDSGNGIFVDAGTAYVTGSTTSDSPNPFPTTFGAFSRTYGGSGDAFVTKIDPAAQGINDLVYSTYLGGRNSDVGYGIVVDSGGNAVVTGSTASPDFPLENPLTTNEKLGGGTGTSTDAFVTTLNSAGTAVSFSTYLGGANTDIGKAVTVDSSNNIYVAGSTDSPNFPLENPLPNNGILGGGTSTSTDAFVVKITPSAPPTPPPSGGGGGGGGCFIATASAFEPRK